LLRQHTLGSRTVWDRTRSFGRAGDPTPLFGLQSRLRRGRLFRARRGFPAAGRMHSDAARTGAGGRRNDSSQRKSPRLRRIGFERDRDDRSRYIWLRKPDRSGWSVAAAARRPRLSEALRRLPPGALLVRYRRRHERIFAVALSCFHLGAAKEAARRLRFSG